MIELHNLIATLDEQLAEVTDRMAAAARQAATQREAERRYVLAQIGTLDLAIAIDDLSEIGPLPEITMLPNLPGWIQGIVNIRSEIVSVIDLGRFIGFTQQASGGKRLAVLRHKKRKIGIRVDRIAGTVSRTRSETTALKSADKVTVDRTLFTAGLRIDKKFYYILNVPILLNLKRLVNYNAGS